MAPAIEYQRVLLKLSGEALMGEQGHGIDPLVLQYIADEVAKVHALGTEIAIVIGGGNILRGKTAASAGMDRAQADYMGMLATVINALALQDALEHAGLTTRVQTGIEMPAVAEPFIRRRAIRHLEQNRVVILAAGTGNPYFTTDTTAILRAAEMECDTVLKATDVDGVYTADPKRDPSAKRYEHLDHQEALDRNLKIMDATAFALARENRMPIIVFSIRQPGAIETVLRGRGHFTTVG